MPEFLCQVGEPAGDLRRLRLTARDADAARQELQSQGLHVFAVRRTSAFASFGRLFEGGAPFLRRRPVRGREVLLFNQELAALLHAGLPLAESLGIMVERMENPTLREAVQTILSEVKSGVPMSTAAARYPFFPSVYPACLQAGETSGDLAGMIVRFTDAMRVAVKARSSLTAAMVYPAFLLAALLGTAGYLLLGVVPNFVPFFAGFGQELPPLTTTLLATAEFVRTHLLWVIAGLLAAILVFAAWSRTARAKRIRDRAVLRLPAIGEVLRLYAVSQFARSLGTLLAGGMPLVSAIPVGARAVGNRYLRSVLEPTAGEVREGRSFVETLAETGEVPGFALQMVRVGEGTGDLARMVSSVADFNDEVIENRVTVLLSLLTPVVLLVLGGFVALVLLAIYLPLFSLASVPQF